VVNVSETVSVRSGIWDHDHDDYDYDPALATSFERWWSDAPQAPGGKFTVTIAEKKRQDGEGKGKAAQKPVSRGKVFRPEWLVSSTRR
jgi:hypothetical protein